MREKHDVNWANLNWIHFPNNNDVTVINGSVSQNCSIVLEMAAIEYQQCTAAIDIIPHLLFTLWAAM